MYCRILLHSLHYKILVVVSFGLFYHVIVLQFCSLCNYCPRLLCSTVVIEGVRRNSTSVEFSSEKINRRTSNDDSAAFALRTFIVQ